MTNRTPLIEFSGVTKAFGETQALREVSFSVMAGEIHAVLGENGAGKTTLMKTLMGFYRPDSGSILYKGKETHFKRPKDALVAKIGMVFQDLSLIPTLTVEENLLLGDPRTSFWLRNGSLHSVPREGLLGSIDLATPVHELSHGERQRVEIFRVLTKGADVLILDEPTSVLSPLEADSLFQTLAELKGQGKTILLVTHRLAEVFGHADRVSVLREGEHVATVGREELSPKPLTRMMVGEDLANSTQEGPLSSDGGVVLSVRDLSLADHHGPRQTLSQVHFEVRAGECLGVAGVAGNGQRQLLDILSQKEQGYTGQILYRGEHLNGHHRARVAYIPDNAREIAVAPELSVLENVMLKDFSSPQYSRFAVLDDGALRAEATRRLHALDVRYPGLDAPARSLSGGNVQKLILAREFAGRHELILAANPTSGLDIKAAADVRHHLRAKRNDGSALLLVSHDLDEIFALADRVMVLYRGRNMGTWPLGDITFARLGSLMAGYEEEVAADSPPEAKVARC